MAKAGLRRPDPEAPHGTEARQRNQFSKNSVSPVPELQGKAKHGNQKARPIIADSETYQVFHNASTDGTVRDQKD